MTVIDALTTIPRRFEAGLAQLFFRGATANAGWYQALIMC